MPLWRNINLVLLEWEVIKIECAKSSAFFVTCEVKTQTNGTSYLYETTTFEVRICHSAFTVSLNLFFIFINFNLQGGFCSCRIDAWICDQKPKAQKIDA